MADNLRQRLEPGDLVLVEHYFTGDEARGYPGRMVLAKVGRDYGDFINDEKRVVLWPLEEGDNPLFEVERRYEGIEYILTVNGMNISTYPGVNNNHPVHFGRAEVLEVLNKTPQYKPYADVLRATDPVLLAEKEKRDLEFIGRDARQDCN